MYVASFSVLNVNPHTNKIELTGGIINMQIPCTSLSFFSSKRWENLTKNRVKILNETEMIKKKVRFSMHAAFS